MASEKQSVVDKTPITRRELFRLAGGGAIFAAAALAGCRTDSMKPELEGVMAENSPQIKDSTAYRQGQLLKRTSLPTKEPATPGLHSLPLGNKREAFLYVPKGYKRDKPAPFVLLLHGAGGNAGHGIGLLRHLADDAGLIIASPKSLTATWDVIASDYGPDVEYIDRVLEYVIGRYVVDRSRLAVGGFSDGASYALSLGVINGDLFTHVIAFSPGFMVPTRQTGRPRIYVSHGTGDRVLPIDRCSRRLVPQLKRADYDVLYREFEGPHTIPPEVARESVQWFIEPRRPNSHQEPAF